MAALALDQVLTNLDARRRELGMSVPALAKRSKVSTATVNRILAGRYGSASHANVAAVARALGVRLFGRPRDPEHIRQEAAKRKARWLVKLVQGTSGLEAQAVRPEVLRRMVKETVRELLAGSSRRLWGD